MRSAVSMILCLLLAAQPATARQEIVLAEGTPVVIHPAHELRSDKLHTGDAVELLVSHPVRAGGVVVVAEGARVLGRVTKARHAAGVGQSGELQLAVDSVQAVDGTWLRLRSGSERRTGGDNTALAVGLAVLVNVFAVFIQGREAVVKADQQITVYLNEARAFVVTPASAPVAVQEGPSVAAVPPPAPASPQEGPLQGGGTVPYVEQHVMCRAVSPSGEPVEVARGFGGREAAVWTWFRLAPAPRSRTYEVLWIHGDTLMARQTVVVGGGKDRAWTALRPGQGDGLAPGNWTVHLMLDGDVQSVQSFAVEP